jgi:hypothetical protein
MIFFKLMIFSDYDDVLKYLVIMKIKDVIISSLIKMDGSYFQIVSFFILLNHL